MASVKLVTRDGRQLWAKVDPQDLDLVERFQPWYAWVKGPNMYPEANFYVRGHHVRFFMHTLIMGCPPAGKRITHRNGQGLDNHRANLRFATQSELLAMRRPTGSATGTASKYKGVCWDTYRNRWMVQFRGKKIGRFTDEIEAAKAFDAAARAYWGPDCYQNFPEDG